MCGIAGFCDFKKKSNKQTLVTMTDVLNHRGPDDSGYSFYENNYAHVGLGHRRLSILDLSTHGHQPMAFENLDIIYNGEVYNFKEIRAELEKFNYTFESDSDTEVILKAYHKWGIKAVDKFIGMFAIAIYDKSQQKMIFVRDRAGVKPFYYYNKDGLFMFASELKSFHENSGFEKNINKDALALYLKYGYILEPYSIFEHTHKLQAGHYLELNIQNSKLSIHKYWDVVDSYNKPKLDISENEAIVETEKLLKSACEYRMVSDVPVGMFLSGGYDSSVVTALLQHERKEKLKTFTIGFKEKGFDEAPYAKEIAKHLGTDHTEFYCTAKDALEIIPKLCEIYDEPFGDSSAIPTTLVSQIAKKQVSVSLSADGGDEIFGGYGKYTGITKKLDTFAKVPDILKPILAKSLRQNIVHKSAEKFAGMFEAKTRCERFADILSHDEKQMLKETGQFTKKQLSEVLNYKHKELFTNFDTDIQDDRLSNLLAIDYKTYMVDDILHKVDRATMSVSLEGREPLLDHRIIEFVAQLPSDMKIKDGDKKWLLKQITHKYLPKQMMDRPKQGFGVPIQEWFKDELKEYFEKYLSKKALSEHELFDIDEILKMKKQYLADENVGVTKLWYMLMFQMWYEKWM